jgi:BirA family biotin operon repressor/biotin-[acetyl-CoA-carboxylase] ligase
MPLDPSAASAGVGLVSHDRLDSTNAEALRLARAGERGPLWITAAAQTSGRGRRGRTWVSEPGNLYASLLLTEPSPPDRAAELSFVAALAVHDAIAACAPAFASRLTLKWPNDCLLDGKKLAGILIEGEGRSVVVGIGVNCAHHPAEAAYPATDLAAAGADVTPERLFTALSGSMLRRLGQWDRGAGFSTIRCEWLDRAFGIGQPIRLALPDGERHGRFESVDERGSLILRLQDGSSEAITAGEIISARSQSVLASLPR